ncbi:hypothetical protein [Flavobacterium sp.]|jgi:MFS family permease|uniref:hypothetical protein n=1 Tax=Flavobacterium sp. TaxID=239 RepID=UPI0037C19AC6
MDKNTTKIDHAIANGYSVDLGTVIEKAFENYKKIALLGGLAYLLIVLAIVGIGSALAVTMLGINDFTEILTNLDPTKFTAVGIIIYVLGMVIISGLASPINAGFFKMAHLAEHNKEFSIGTIFDYYKTAYFKELFIAASLLALINLGITFLFEFLEYQVIGVVFTYIITFFTLLYLPLIVFGNQNGIDALVKSIQLVVKQPFIVFALAVVGIVGVLVGLIGLCIGIFFTIPFWNSIIYTLYNTVFPADETSEIEDIGTTLD